MYNIYIFNWEFAKYLVEGTIERHFKVFISKLLKQRLNRMCSIILLDEQ